MIPVLEARTVGADLSAFSRALHWFQEGDRFFALHHLSPVLYEVSPVAHALLTSDSPEISPDQEQEVEEDYRRLLRAGYIPQRRTEKSSQAVESMTLNMVRGCNLACTYCIVDQGWYGVRVFQKMTPEVIEASIHLLLDLAPEGTPLEIRFFGGEPLLNWPGIRHAMEFMEQRAPHRTLHYQIVTNGWAMTEEIADFLALRSCLVTISIDGSREHHDRHRPTLDGKGSYDRALAAVRLLQSRKVRLLLRGTSADPFQNPLPDALRELEPLLVPENGDEARIGTNYALWRLPADAPTGRKLREQSLEILRQTYDRFANSPSQLGASRLPMLQDLVFGTSRPGRACEAGIRSFQVDVTGGVYTCAIGTMNPALGYGTVQTGMDRDKWIQLRKKFLSVPEECLACPAREMCSQGCHITRSRGETIPVLCDRIRDEQREVILGFSRLQYEHFRKVWEVSEPAPEIRNSFDRAFAMREMLRVSNRHLRPLTIFGDWSQE